MPFTPFHVGPHATLGLFFNRFIDLPAFVFANIAVDIEPLVVMVLRLNYPLHGYCHTFLVGGLIGLLWGVLVANKPAFFTNLMSFFQLPYESGKKKTIASAIAGVWLHILFDSPLYHDIRPFFPSDFNPFYGLVSHFAMYLICSFLFITAGILYGLAVYRAKKATEIK